MMMHELEIHKTRDNCNQIFSCFSLYLYLHSDYWLSELELFLCMNNMIIIKDSVGTFQTRHTTTDSKLPNDHQDDLNQWISGLVLDDRINHRYIFFFHEKRRSTEVVIVNSIYIRYKWWMVRVTDTHELISWKEERSVYVQDDYYYSVTSSVNERRDRKEVCYSLIHWIQLLDILSSKGETGYMIRRWIRGGGGSAPYSLVTPKPSGMFDTVCCAFENL